MITYAHLTRHPAAAPSLIGMTLPAFEALWADVEPAHRQRLRVSPLSKRTKAACQRAVGAGPKYRYALRDRLWLTLFWLKVYTTYEVMGFFYDLNKTHVEDILQDILATLATLSTFVLEHPDPSRRKLHSVGEVMDAFPEIRWVIDATEQRIQRPQSTKDNDRQKPYYSGKKKAHPLKTQVVVAPNGQIGAVSESVSGGSPHDLTLLRQTHLIERLAPDEGGMMDKGYQGLQKDYPQRRLYLPFKARRGHPLTQDQKADNRQLARYRIVVEHTLAQMQHVGVLAQVYRQDRDGHSQVVRVVAGLVQRRIERHR